MTPVGGDGREPRVAEQRELGLRVLRRIGAQVHRLPVAHEETSGSPRTRITITGGSFSVLCYAQDRLARDAFAGSECRGGFSEWQHGAHHRLEASIPYSRGEVGEPGAIGFDNEENSPPVGVGAPLSVIVYSSVMSARIR